MACASPLQPAARRWFLSAWLLAALCLSGTAWGVTAYSRTGQFVIHSNYPTTPTLSQWLEPTNSTRITLSPDPLTVTCERIKTAVLRQLDLADHWRGKVHVWIRPELRREAAKGLVSTRFADGWHYTLDLPERCEADALVRLLVQTILTEIANRTPGTHPAELPIWFVEGMTARVRGSVGPDVIVTPTPLRTRIGTAGGQIESGAKERVGAENLQEIHAALFGRPPVSFAELSQPGAAIEGGEARETYRLSAELFLYQLQQLANGRRCLQAMLANLTRSMNWQTAFLTGFEPHFGRLLDVEKWWTVTLHDFLRGNQPNTWAASTSLNKLAEATKVHVDIQERAGAPPRPASVTLQQFIAQANPTAQRTVLRARMAYLADLQRRAAPNVTPLIRSYAAVIEDYLTQRGRSGYSDSTKRAGALPPALLVQQTTRRLDELDRLLDRQRQAATPAPSATRP